MIFEGKKIIISGEKMKINNIKFLIAGATMVLTQMSSNLAHADEFTQNQQTPEQKMQAEENAKYAKEMLGNFFNKGKDLAKTATTGLQSGIHHTAKFVQEKTAPTEVKETKTIKEIKIIKGTKTTKETNKIEVSESVKTLATSPNTDEVTKNFNIFKDNVSNIIGNIRAKATEPSSSNNNNNAP